MLRISFETEDGRGTTRDQLDEALAGLGFVREAGAPSVIDVRGKSAVWAEQPPEEKTEIDPVSAPTARDEAVEPEKRRPGRPRKAAAEPETPAPAVEQPAEPAPQITASPEDRKELEPAAPPTEPKKLTHDDVRRVLKSYVTKFGMDAAVEDASSFMGAAKTSEIPDDQAALSKAIRAIEQAVESNPFDRAVVG